MDFLCINTPENVYHGNGIMAIARRSQVSKRFSDAGQLSFFDNGGAVTLKYYTVRGSNCVASVRDEEGVMTRIHQGLDWDVVLMHVVGAEAGGETAS